MDNIINVANAVKDVIGVINYKVIQNELNSIELIIIKDEKFYNSNQESKFINNWRDRVGDKMMINLKYVKDIPVEKSGKFRVIENNIKHLIENKA